MPDPFLSVVIPVYNVEAYLADLVASLSPLATRSVEVIFVEDCSTDGSAARLAELLSASPLNSRVIKHAKNQGLSGARNTGQADARGTYVWFVDSDDTINPAELPAWFSILETHGPDIVVFDYANFQPGEILDWSEGYPVVKFADTIWRPKPRRTPAGKLMAEGSNDLMEQALRDLRMHAWSYCFKRSLLPPAPFPLGKVYEDLATIPLILHAAKTTYYHPGAMIYYRNRPDSITKFVTAKRDLDLAHSMRRDWDHIARNRDKFSTTEVVAYLATWLKTQLWAINNLHNSGHLEEPDVFNQFMDGWRSYRRAAGWRQFSAILQLPRPTLASRLAAVMMTISPRMVRFLLRRFRLSAKDSPP